MQHHENATSGPFQSTVYSVLYLQVLSPLVMICAVQKHNVLFRLDEQTLKAKCVMLCSLWLGVTFLSIGIPHVV